VEYLPLVGVAVVLLTALSSAWALIRSGYTSARADDAEKRINGLRGEITDYERRERDLMAKVTELATRIEALENENKTLRSFVPTQDELEEVKRLAMRHYAESTSFFTEWRDTIRWFREQVTTVAQHLENLRRGAT
jgi:predicted  nucleic acid-binding Zn-ribbon protein